MRNRRLRQGDVVPYPYLRSEQRDRGETEGRKVRPACLVLRMRDPDHDIHHLMLVAIASRQPLHVQHALEVPDTERKRANLARYPRAWIIVNEYNCDIAERSWYLEPDTAPLGTFSETFLRQVTDALRKEMRRGARRIDRTK